MNTDIYYTENEIIDLTKCYFMLCKNFKGGLLLKTIYTSAMDKTDIIFSYSDVEKMDSLFYIKNDKKTWDSFKTFKGFINRINKELKTIKLC